MLLDGRRLSVFGSGTLDILFSASAPSVVLGPQAAKSITGAIALRHTIPQDLRKPM